MSTNSPRHQARGKASPAPASVTGDAARALLSEATALLEAERLDEACPLAERLVQMRPKDATFRNLLGVIHRRRGDMTKAIATFREALRLDPRLFSAAFNLARCQYLAGDFAAAIEGFRKLTRQNPKHAEALRLLGVAQEASGDRATAAATLKRALMVDPRSIEAWQDRIRVVSDLGDAAGALADVDRALAVAPTHRDLRRTRGILYRRLANFPAAQEIYEQLLAEDPNDVQTLLCAANLFYYSLADTVTAVDLIRRAHALAPDRGRVVSTTCKMLMDARHDDEGKLIDEAYAAATAFLSHNPPTLDLAANLLSVFQRTCDFDNLARLGDFAPLVRHFVEHNEIGTLLAMLSRVHTPADRRTLVTEHRRWGDMIERRITPLPPRKPALASKKIRIGFMSSDLRNHPVTYFLQSFIDSYDRSRFELYGYSFYPKAPDAAQAHIAKTVDGFRLMHTVADRGVVEQMQADGLDILFELGGTTRFNRLDIMAHRPAPISVSWLGYPHSAGLSRIDYILVDPYLRPPEADLLIERPFEVPHSWVSIGEQGMGKAEIELGTPEGRQGCLTFGTMNNPLKYTAEGFALWARIMAEVPGSRFLFVRPESSSAAFRRNIEALFAAGGIAADRIGFEAVRGRHLPHYNRIDITLDCFPQTGGTTTCESLWMAVPVVTRVGPAFFERLSYSNLSNAGLGDLCAHTDEDYVRIAVALAADRPRREDLRATMRQRLRGQPLGDWRRWVEDFQDTIAATVAAHAG